MNTTDDDVVCVRLRFSRQQVETLDRIRRFIGLPSVSSTVARLAMWNAREIDEALTALSCSRRLPLESFGIR